MTEQMSRTLTAHLAVILSLNILDVAVGNYRGSSPPLGAPHPCENNTKVPEFEGNNTKCSGKWGYFFGIPALGVCSSPSKGPQPRARMDVGSRTMYSLNLGTCSFTRVRCVPRKDTTGGKTWV